METVQSRAYTPLGKAVEAMKGWERKLTDNNHKRVYQAAHRYLRSSGWCGLRCKV